MVGKFKRLFWLWIQCIISMRKVITLMPFLIYAILQIFLLYSLTHFSQSPFSSVLVPIVQKTFGEPALHYPNFYLVLTSMFSQINIILSGSIGIIFVGMATYIFALNFRNNEIHFSEAFKITITKYVVLFLIWVIVSALSFLMIMGLPIILKKFFSQEYFLGRIFDLVGLLLGIVVTSMFSYTTVLVVLERKKILEVILNTFSIFFKNPGTSFFLIAIPTVFYFPISYLSRRIDLILTRLSPESIVTILAIGIFITFISSYFQVGSITRFYLLLNEPRKYDYK
jgi:hypothetical protein